MNDFSEVEHGKAFIQAVMTPENQSRLTSLLPKRSDHYTASDGSNTQSVVASTLEAALSKADVENTFITSFSFHNEKEADLGRLSMWRAYGGQTSIAMVFKAYLLPQDYDRIFIDHFPVIYRDIGEAKEWFEQWIERLEKRLPSYERHPNPYGLIGGLAHFFEVMIQTLKHPGFKEEREYRLISQGPGGLETWLKRKSVPLAGRLQNIVEIDMNKAPVSRNSASVGERLDHIVIGPTPDAAAIEKMLRHALASIESGGDVEIKRSNIPFRRVG